MPSRRRSRARARARARAAGALLFGAAALVGCQDCDKSSVSHVEAGITAPVEAAAPTPEGGALNATPLPTASVAAKVNPDGLPPYSGPTGSVEGTITVIGDSAPVTPHDFSRCPDAESTYGHAFREGPPGANGARPLGDAIVVVTGYANFYLPETGEAEEVRIERCAPTTRTLSMTFGQRLEVKNLSKDFWTPVLEPGPSLVLMMATPNGDPAKIYPKHPGHFLLRDHDRKYAVVDVYVFRHPLHTTSSIAGFYRIDGIPVGKRKVSTMHPQIDDAKDEKEITVSAGVVHKVDLVLKNVNRDAGPPLRDAGGDAPSPPLR